MTISKKSPHYKEFKKDVEFFNGMKYKDICPVTIKIALEKFIKNKMDKYKLQLLEEIYQVKLK